MQLVSAALPRAPAPRTQPGTALASEALLGTEQSAQSVGMNFTSTVSCDSWLAGSHRQRRTVFTAACARMGCPPLMATSFTLPSASTCTSSLTTPCKAMLRANGGYAGADCWTSFLLAGESCAIAPMGTRQPTIARSSAPTAPCRIKVFIRASLNGASEPGR